jgi:dihydropteroate synthase
MGIINITPDSFFGDSRTQNIESIITKALQMEKDGATIIDIGAQSTRPNSTLLTWQQEWERLEQPLKSIRIVVPNLLISVDTFYSKVAENAVKTGADIINDISGGEMDASMLDCVGQLNVPYVCMHMKGTPQTMQNNPTYEDVTKEVLDYFIAKKFACESAGIKDVIFDVGFGFGKSMEHNFSLLKNLNIFNNILENPLLAGLSRKSMIYKSLDVTANESLNGTTVLNTIALQNGASILRVHDVKEAVQAVKLVSSLQ